FQTIHGGIGLYRGTVDSLGMATDHTCRDAQFKNPGKYAFENRFREQSPGTADGGVPGQLFINIVTQKIQNVQTHVAMLYELTVTGDIFQIPYQAQFKEHHGINTLLTTAPVIPFSLSI